MSQYFSLTETRNRCYRSTFTGSGLRSTINDLNDGTIMHCWIPEIQNESKPNLLLIHGLGANALWQWGKFIRNLTQHFNIYVPDLVFFGGSYTTRSERTDAFQAECVMKVMEMKCVRSVTVVGLSYGGFVAYSLGVKYGEFVERIVICGSGVCLEEKDIKDGLFPVSDLDEAVNILVPQTPQKLRELFGFTFFRAPLVSWLPSCLLLDFIHVSILLSF
jgi:pimeloyl-ACP methyl ester carboxylesterase